MRYEVVPLESIGKSCSSRSRVSADLPRISGATNHHRPVCQLQPLFHSHRPWLASHLDDLPEACSPLEQSVRDLCHALSFFAFEVKVVKSADPLYETQKILTEQPFVFNLMNF